MKYLIITLLLFSFGAQAKKGKIIYKYKKVERFDFDALDIIGNNKSPGDLSIGPRFKKKFKNKIPQRKNFNREMIKSIDSIL